MLFTSFLHLWLAVAADSPEAIFKSAIEDFEFGEHAKAAEKLRQVLEPSPRLSSREDLIVGRQYLGACYHLLDDKTKAKAQFSMLLALDPKHKLDPEVFSPALVEFFEQVRAEAGISLRADDPRRTEPRDPVQLPRVPPPEPPPMALALIPFGVGQFNNRHPVRGALFAAGEVGLFATAGASFLMFEGLKVPERERMELGCAADVACFRSVDDADRASTLQSLYLAAFWSGVGLAALGVLEALVSYPGELESPPGRGDSPVMSFEF